jgi:hypothetical protein
MDTRNKKRGKPPQEAWYVSEENREVIKSVISRTKKAIALLENGDEFPSRINFRQAKDLLSLAKNEMGTIEKNPIGFSPLEDFDFFFEKCVEFSEGAWEVVKILYEAYLELCVADETDIEEGAVFSRTRFTRMVAAKYKDRIHESVRWVDGKSARCFIGLRLKELEAAENDG